MLETLADCDDVLMEKYFDDPSTITEDEIRVALRKGTLAMRSTPCSAALHSRTRVSRPSSMLSPAYLPSPYGYPPKSLGTDPDDPEKEIIRKVDPSSPLTALAFKIATDPYVGRLCFFRVYAGELPAGSYVYNSRSGKKERISRLFQMHSNKQNPMEVIGCGDIGCWCRLQGYPYG